MEKFTNVSGVAAPMPLVNIDTDMIIPKQFLKTIKRSGLGVNLFDEMRYNQDGSEISDFVLNQLAYRNAEIIIAGENFGCGSSREHAPWALKDFGISVVISESFADIFYNNCCKNGVLPVQLGSRTVATIIEEVEAIEGYEMKVDLEGKTISLPDGKSINFEIDESLRQQLLFGLDTISLTMEYKKDILEYEAKHRKAAPWLFDNSLS